MAATRVGLIGAGGVAQRHARVLSGLPDVQVVGVTDVVPEAAEKLAAEHGTRALPDVAALLESGLDAAYVCVPPFAHGPAERAVIAAGLPLFVEKPIALNLDDAQEINGLIAERDLLTSVGHHWRYLAIVEQARELLGDRPVRLVSGAWLDKVPPVGWWPHRDRSGGPVVEQAAHVLDLARHLAGEVVEVSAIGNPAPPVDGADVDSATAATLRFAGGAVGTLAATCVLGWKERAGLEVYADGLALAITETSLVVRDADGTRTYESDPDSARVAVDRAFIEAVRGEGSDIRVPYAEALKTHALAVAVAESVAHA
ncbi:Gfo/Idh/MocA family protein [Actinoplanes friuliensis]|jgi:myo-inositol 2-dehydrogenase / D-chiro-inositol 1-dehydrogenase|uniref:Gfo/Idh/MocA family protein n=1 Tax=Actinoplanes friuliensis TaxID=196914 RepID=UPI0004251B3D|nr:Gfo/Idh/MocA family oxidoreductase [Actinoplanes friuliensis]